MERVWTLFLPTLEVEGIKSVPSVQCMCVCPCTQREYTTATRIYGELKIIG